MDESQREHSEATESVPRKPTFTGFNTEVPLPVETDHDWMPSHDTRPAPRPIRVTGTV